MSKKGTWAENSFAFFAQYAEKHYLCMLKDKYKDIIMEATKKNNLIARLLEYKQAMRKCIQNGANTEEMKQITKDYGFTLSTPL